MLKLAKTTSDRLPPPDPERTEEAKQVVQEHADDLRKTIDRLRKKLS
jgi:signal transduction histidine kinase